MMGQKPLEEVRAELERAIGASDLPKPEGNEIADALTRFLKAKRVHTSKLPAQGGNDFSANSQD